MPAKKAKKGGAVPKTEDEMNAANSVAIQSIVSQMAAKDPTAGAALAKIAAAFAKDTKAPAGGGAGGSSSGSGSSDKDKAKAVADALELLGGAGGAGGADDASGTNNLGKVQKKFKKTEPDPKQDPTKLVSVPCFICRPTEFKLLRETMTDRNVYASTYSEYLKENYDFCHEMAVKNGYQVLRGTWDVKHYLTWCQQQGVKPRAASRKAYFQQLAELAVAGKIDEPRPSFEQYINDTSDFGLLRFCCRLGSDGDTPTPAPPVPDGPAPRGTGEQPTSTATATDAATATATAPAPAPAPAAAASDAKSTPSTDGKTTKKKKAATENVAACGKLETKPNEFALCTGCKCAVYCSAECQKRDWKTHKKWCAPVL